MEQRTITPDKLNWVLEKFFTYVVQNKQQGLIDNIILVGGSALCVQKIRLESIDIDWMTTGKENRDLIDLVQHDFKIKFGEIVEIDITRDNRIWGQIRIEDIQNSPIYKKVVIHNQEFTVRAITAETLFILKSDAMRDKDIKDLSVIAKATTPEKICNRLHEIIQFNDEDLMLLVADNVLSELQVHYFFTIDNETIQRLGFSQKRSDILKENFGVQQASMDETDDEDFGMKL